MIQQQQQQQHNLNEQDVLHLQSSEDGKTIIYQDDLSCDDEISAIKGKPVSNFVPIHSSNKSPQHSTTSKNPQDLQSRSTMRLSVAQPSTQSPSTQSPRVRSVSPNICVRPESNVHAGHGGVCLRKHNTDNEQH